MTLDSDDRELASQLLSNRGSWRDTQIAADYEASFAKWNGSRYAFAFMSGREALSACIYSLNLQPGDEVILPGYTCIVVPNALQYAGLVAVFCDIELDTYGLDASQVEQKITSRTRAILIHHLYGLVARDYEQTIELARRYGLKVIEDCAHATGAELNGLSVGNRGDLAFYSSERSKIFNTIQGGIAVSNDSILAQRLREYHHLAEYPDNQHIERQLQNVILEYYSAKHPQRWWLADVVNILYGDKKVVSTTKEEERGVRPKQYGRKMPPAVCALAINQLAKIQSYNELRRTTAEKWNEWCSDNKHKPPTVVPGSVPAFLRYPVLVEPERKSNTAWALKDLGITLGVWFLTNTHPAPSSIENCPNANKAVTECINFPCLLG